MHGAVFGEVGRFLDLDLWPVAAHEEHACHEGAEDLGEDIVRNLLPGKTLPDREADGDSWVEVPARDGRAGDDGEGDAEGEAEADLQDISEDCGGKTGGRGRVQIEGCHGRDTREAVVDCQW